MTDDGGRMGRPDGEDDAMDLEQLLREAVARVDPIPPGLIRYAAEAQTVGTLDGELADLAWDSWIDRAELTRGTETRMLTFGPAGPAGTRLHVEVVRGDNGFELTGRVDPPIHRQIRVDYHGGFVDRPVDERGRFAADLPIARAIRFRLHGEQPPVSTGWVPIG
jgi:hypothetical protein